MPGIMSKKITMDSYTYVKRVRDLENGNMNVHLIDKIQKESLDYITKVRKIEGIINRDLVDVK